MITGFEEKFVETNLVLGALIIILYNSIRSSILTVKGIMSEFR